MRFFYKEKTKIIIAVNSICAVYYIVAKYYYNSCRFFIQLTGLLYILLVIALLYLAVGIRTHWLSAVFLDDVLFPSRQPHVLFLSIGNAKYGTSVGNHLLHRLFDIHL